MGGAILSFPHTPSWRTRDTFNFHCIVYFSLWLLRERPSMNAHSTKETNRNTSINTIFRCVESHLITIGQYAGEAECSYKGVYTLVTLPRIVTQYHDSVDGTRARVTYQKLVTR